MFILIDAEGLKPTIDYITSLDEREIRSLDAVEDYKPEGDFHIVDITPDELSRWQQLRLATLGARLFSNDFDKESPIYAGPVPEGSKLRKVVVDASNAATRAGHMASYGVNYIGRTKLSPRNVFILDNKKGNPLHDPSKDATLEALYASLPDDWWGSCGFVSSSNIERLEAFLLSDDMQSVIPLGYTTGSFSKLKFMALEYVEAPVPTGRPDYGIAVRDAANRLSYKLSLEGQPEPEKPEGGSWLQL